jgi:hypothetical protein
MLAPPDTDFVVLERGWLSSNSIVFTGGEQMAVVDTGYCSHSDQTRFLLRAALHGRGLDTIVNTVAEMLHCSLNILLHAY